MSEAAEILFYHLERQTLERALPLLVEKSLERGWRAVVRVGTPERLEVLDSALWTYREDSFLPHSRDGDGDVAGEPVVLTGADANPNSADVLFVVDRAGIDARAGYQRVVYMFDGRDPDAVTQAREVWKTVRDAGEPATYWQQAGNGRWEKKASTQTDNDADKG